MERSRIKMRVETPTSTPTENPTENPTETPTANLTDPSDENETSDYGQRHVRIVADSGMCDRTES